MIIYSTYYGCTHTKTPKMATITFVTKNFCPLMSSRDHGVQYVKRQSSIKPNKP